MTVYDPEALARQTAQQIALLNQHLAVAPPQQAARILGQVLDPATGILGALTTLVATGARFEQDRASAGLLPPEVWLTLGRAANELHYIALDLDNHAEDIQRLTRDQQTATVPPVPSALVARRHR
ncbi:hypothetical protein [Streptomyces antarcticus]|uniref:hypothetical protein n=1 Tax=Streptomyces antarcticus TaxID=2996458 RepID=UPI00226EA70B|nr:MULTISPECIES: hypothetical protein [unclassified Streptomyces]MCY0942333.1 hypothetical protein [Streptomyces sp. H34-AA3]MCZ4080670.1 hypothetical protein [Streptomyces sp. H34-S5]